MIKFDANETLLTPLYVTDIPKSQSDDNPTVPVSLTGSSGGQKRTECHCVVCLHSLLFSLQSHPNKAKSLNITHFQRQVPKETKSVIAI